MLLGQSTALSSKVEAAFFESEILLCVRKGLESFGRSFAEVVSYNMTRIAGLKFESIPRKPDKFEECLDQIFLTGSIYLKNAIIEQVKTTFALIGEYLGLKDCFEDSMLISQSVHQKD